MLPLATRKLSHDIDFFESPARSGIYKIHEGLAKSPGSLKMFHTLPRPATDFSNTLQHYQLNDYDDTIQIPAMSHRYQDFIQPMQHSLDLSRYMSGKAEPAFERQSVSVP